MMDIQKVFDAISASSRVTRSGYHLTLGGLRGALTQLPADAAVAVDTGGSVGKEESYRGYYDDLSFQPNDRATVAELLAACERARTQEYEGYKGGEFRYADDTPLWIAHHGCTGRAIIAAVPHGDGLKLITKDME